MYLRNLLRHGALLSGLLVGLASGAQTPRVGHTATLLPDGTVLVAGGQDGSGTPLDSAEIYDPATGWTAAPAGLTARAGHTATVLPNGQVLIVGGEDGSGPTASCQQYDPLTGTWTDLGAVTGVASVWHTATLLSNGRGLIAGGLGYPLATPGAQTALGTAGVYDPSTGVWTEANTKDPMTARYGHTASLLPDGTVLVAGGMGLAGSPIADTQRFIPGDPTAGISPGFQAATPMSSPRVRHTATVLPSGEVLVVGGFNGTDVLDSAVLYHPDSDTWTPAGSLSQPREHHTATLLPSGKVLIAGGDDGADPASSAELYDPVSNTWTLLPPLSSARAGHTATLLPSGNVLLVGGSTGSGVASPEVWSYPAGRWIPTGLLVEARALRDALVLPSSRVLVIGGADPSFDAQIYDPRTASWMETTGLPDPIPPISPAAVSSSDGRVLVIGGDDRLIAEAALYDEATDTWISSTMVTPRISPGAVRLADGRVLAAGGVDDGATTRSAEVYDPAGNRWSPVASMSDSRKDFGVILLPSGKVLVAGGWSDDAAGYIRGCELFDPANNIWTSVPDLPTAMVNPHLFLRADGNVVAVSDSGEAALFNVSSPGWSPLASSNRPHSNGSFVQLPSGKILAAGGDQVVTEIYDPQMDTWTDTGALNLPRKLAAMAVLPSGWVLIAGGENPADGTPLDSAELYAPIPDVSARRPVIAGPVAGSSRANRARVTGSNFRGGTGASGSTTSGSPTDYPVFVLTGEGLTLAVPFTSLDDTSAMLDLGGAPPGDYQLTATVNGISSEPVALSVLLNVEPVTADQSVTTAEDTAVDITLPGSDLDGDALDFTVFDPPNLGELTGTAPNLTYTPDPDANGTDSFSFEVEDQHGGFATGTVVITVTPVQDPPVAQDQSVSDPEDNLKNIILGPKTDVDGDALTYTITSPPSSGLLSGTKNDRNYVPNPDFNGTDQFTFQVDDGNGNTAQGTVTITVTPLNDPPVSDAQSVEQAEDTPIPITLTASDVDGDALTFTVTAQPAHGTLSGSGPNLVYTPAPDYFGTDAFSFTANDGTTDSIPATVKIEVTPVDDAPIALDQTLSLSEDGAVSLTLAGQDVETDVLSYRVVTPPAHGALSGAPPNLTYTPNPDFNGTDSFAFAANDGALDSAPGTVTFQIAAVNDSPVAHAQTVSVSSGSSVALTLLGSDVDGDALTYTVVSQPAHGTLSGTAPGLGYTPAPGYTGSDSFTFQVGDGTETSAPATVTLQVGPATDTAPTSPELLFPDADGKLPAGKVQFGWRPSADLEGDAVHYHLEVLQDGKPVFSADTTETKLTSDLLEDGSYTWRVTAIDAQGLSGQPSEARPLTLLSVTAAGGVGCSTTPGGGSPLAGVLLLAGIGLAFQRRRQSSQE